MSALRINRRAMFGLAFGGAVAATAATIGPTFLPQRAGRLLESGLELPAPFQVPLPVPEPIRPVGSPGGIDHYELVQRSVYQEILPGVQTGVWGYDGIFPGPLFDVRAGKPITVEVINQLPVPTSTHLHGGVTPQGSDGYPTDLVLPSGGGFTPHVGGHHGMNLTAADWDFHDGSKTYEYPMEQGAATLWYHDHRKDFTGPQVWRGLAGMFLVRDDEDDALPLPKGDKDIPLMICDRSFTADGEFDYPALDPRLEEVPGVQDRFMEGVEGDVNLVNGAPWPEHEVSDTRYRLRLLNAANARRYVLRLEPPPAGGSPFVQVGSDLGLLAAPVEHDEVVLAPAERCDTVVDFSSYALGTEVRLINALERGPRRDVMRFRIARHQKDESKIPDVLAEVPLLVREDSRTTRHFDFKLTDDMWTINGQVFDPSGSLADPALGTVELWKFTSDFHHPVHLHMAHFQVLSRSGDDPDPQDTGWKDTVDVRPFETVEVLVRFEGHRGRFMIHCHNLEHEDMAMMANFTVT